jgi:hypothetical protein
LVLAEQQLLPTTVVMLWEEMAEHLDSAQFLQLAVVVAELIIQQHPAG